MTERYRYAIEIECPACRARGLAYASEDDQPLNGLSCFSIDSVPQGFSLARTGATFANSLIVCAGCGGPDREVGGSARARIAELTEAADAGLCAGARTGRGKPLNLCLTKDGERL